MVGIPYNQAYILTPSEILQLWLYKILRERGQNGSKRN